MKTYDEQWMDESLRILNEGTWITNERTGKRCKTVIGTTFTYDVSEGHLPVLTTKKSFWKTAIAEMLGYLRGYDSAKQFREKLNCNTWNANANESKHWLENPIRKGEDDLGRIYGVQGRGFRGPDGEVDQYKRIVELLSQGIDNRRLILTFNNPGEEHLMALPACMHTHNFAVLGDELHMESFQRSSDHLLGQGGWNSVQCAFLLMITAQISGGRFKPGKIRHHVTNSHIYEDQMEIFVKEQKDRVPYDTYPKLKINPDIQSLDDLETWVMMDDFGIEGEYRHHPAIQYPFSA